MKITYFRCVVVRDAMTKIPREGPLWEKALFEEIYGQGNMEDIEEFEHETDSPLLSPEDEMARLSKNFGREKESKIPWAELTFGRGSAGAKVLAQSMKGSIIAEDDKIGAKKAHS